MSLNTGMEKNTEILVELKEISPLLAEIPRLNVHTVPTGYFENLEKRISLCSVLNQEETKNAFIKEKTGIPAGYFESLPDAVLSKIKKINPEETEEDFPVLNSLKKLPVFAVPEGYFTHLSDTILSKVQTKEKAKVVSITGKKWWRYMAAALIAGILLLSGLYIFDSGSKKTTPYLAATKQYQTPSQIEAGLASLKSDDIIDYLETHGNITDNDLFIKNIDTDSLPTEIDYLMDENALNNFLNKINSQQQ